MRVLICDDDKVIRFLLKRVLTTGGDEVVEATHGASVVELARVERPDVIVLDYLMPDMTGAEVVQALAADTELADIPVVFLTGRTDIGPETLSGLGVAGLIEKPFDTTTLAARLRRYAGVGV